MKVKNKLSFILNILISVVIVSSIIITIVTLTTNEDGIPSINGYSPFSIQSNSMKPVFKRGDIIFSKKM